MKTMWCTLGIAALVTLAAAAQGPGPTDQDKAAVRQAAYDYGEGFYEGAAERMERGVHPGIIKRGLVAIPGGAAILIPMNAETLVEATRMGAAKNVAADKRDISFELLDVREDIASARIFTSQFDDYLHLVKQNGRWRIANVLWQPPSPAGVTNKEADKAAVAQAVKDFAEAFIAGDTARLERVIHPEGAMRTFRPNNATGRYFLQEGNRDAVVAQARVKKMAPFQNPVVTVLHVYDNIASASTTTSTVMFYSHLARQNDQWRVVNMLLR